MVKKALNHITRNTYKFVYEILSSLGYLLVTFSISNFVSKVLYSRNQHIFFGYYDITPFNFDGNKILAHRTDSCLESPNPNSYVEIGYYNYDKKRFNDGFCKIASSKAWCWQQGSRLRWLRNENQEYLFYNDFRDQKLVGVIRDSESFEEVEILPIPMYDICPKMKVGLSLNFLRLQRLRPGYGYSCIPDHTAGISIPSNDGIFQYCFDTKRTKLLISYAEINEFLNNPEDFHGYQHYINHISINSSGTKFMFLYLMVNAGKRISKFFVCDIDGKNLSMLNSTDTISHYTWRDPDHLLCTQHSNSTKTLEYVLYNVNSKNALKVHPLKLNKDGHPTYFNSLNSILSDTYPNRLRIQNLFIFNIEIGRYIKNFKFYSSRKYNGEWRTDLHPRFDENKSVICIDNEFRGFKSMKLLNLTKH